MLCNEHPGLWFRAKPDLLSALLTPRDGVTAQTLKKTDEIGITGIAATGPVNLFTGKATHLHNVVTGFQKELFVAREWMLTAWAQGFYNESMGSHLKLVLLSCKVFEAFRSAYTETSTPVYLPPLT